jgi:SAM-dependent methyltransferase
MNGPCAWLVHNRHLFPVAGDSLDLACGSGRNAIWLAEQGFSTVAVDRDTSALETLRQEAARRRLPIRVQVVDLEHGRPFLAPAAFDLVVVVHYLYRPLFPEIVGALRRGGVLAYETFTRAQAARGKPTNPAFLLDPGELVSLVRPLTIVASREGDFDGRMVASVVAVK